MAGFLYYIPGIENNQVNRQLFAQHGLGYAFSDFTDKPFARGCIGPDNARGCIVGGCGVPDHAVAYAPDKQLWRKYNGIQIGMYKDDCPMPVELLRQDPLAGTHLTLADNNMWMVPMARKTSVIDGTPSNICVLPLGKADLDENGRWTCQSVDQKYKGLLEIGLAFWDALVNAADHAESDQKTIEFDFEGGNDAAITVLQCNYRIDRMEAAMLGLLDEMAASRILQALVDLKTYQAWLQKKTVELAHDISATANGQPDETTGTNPQ